jgi:hypothetical protein
VHKNYPPIPGVTFKPIVLTQYEGYAVTSDRRVWNGRGGKWRVMETYKFCDGEDAVWLLRNSFGGCMFKVDQLYKEAFGEAGV